MAERRICSIPDCGKPARSKGLCTPHYEKKLRQAGRIGANQTRKCSVDGCARPHRSKGLCDLHYGRMRHRGSLKSSKADFGAGDAFILQAIATETDACIDWPFGQNGSGYGAVSGRKAHRTVCELAHGAPPLEKPYACHSCGRKICVNKRHLRWGSHKENAWDAVAHGTIRRGEKSGGSKLTEAQAEAIKNDHSGLSNVKVGALYGVSSATAGSIRKGRTWKHLP